MDLKRLERMPISSVKTVKLQPSGIPTAVPNKAAKVKQSHHDPESTIVIIISLHSCIENTSNKQTQKVKPIA